MNNDLNQAFLRRLLKVNTAVAVFVLLANGSALFIGLSGKAPDVLANLLEISLILSVATAVVVTTALALAKPEYCQKALAFQAVAISVGAVAMMLWGLSLAMQPTEVLGSSMKVSWSVGWLTALTSYSAYLVSHTFLAHANNNSSVVKYAYIWVGAIAFFVDVFVFVRLAATVL